MQLNVFIAFRFINTINEVVQENPELILLLGLHDTFKTKKSIAVPRIAKRAPTKNMTTVQTQTELHPIPYRKVSTYVWNIWDLRRKAIQLANIQNCRTHSTQTMETAHRFDIGTQTHESISRFIQTNSNKSITTSSLLASDSK